MPTNDVPSRGDANDTRKGLGRQARVFTSPKATFPSERTGSSARCAVRRDEGEVFVRGMAANVRVRNSVSTPCRGGGRPRLRVHDAAGGSARRDGPKLRGGVGRSPIFRRKHEATAPSHAQMVEMVASRQTGAESGASSSRTREYTGSEHAKGSRAWRRRCRNSCASSEDYKRVLACLKARTIRIVRTSDLARSKKRARSLACRGN